MESQEAVEGKNKSVVSQGTVYISGEAWKLSIGDVGRASDMAEVLADVGYTGLGVDDTAENGAVGETSSSSKGIVYARQCNLGTINRR